MTVRSSSLIIKRVSTWLLPNLVIAVYQCSRSCGGGVQERGVFCPGGLCDWTKRPTSTMSCNEHLCCHWATGNWDLVRLGYTYFFYFSFFFFFNTLSSRVPVHNVQVCYVGIHVPRWFAAPINSSFTLGISPNAIPHPSHNPTTGTSVWCSPSYVQVFSLFNSHL